MKFGIFYELQLPRPWDIDSEHKLYKNALAQCELADQLGFDYAWEVEHPEWQKDLGTGDFIVDSKGNLT